MICRQCPHAKIGSHASDRDMSRLGYRSCEMAKTPEEKATYFKGDQECRYPERVKK